MQTLLARNTPTKPKAHVSIFLHPHSPNLQCISQAVPAFAELGYDEVDYGASQEYEQQLLEMIKERKAQVDMTPDEVDTCAFLANPTFSCSHLIAEHFE